MPTLKTRLDRLETETWAAERARIQAQLAAMTDAELEAVIAGGDPETAAIIHAMTDEELEGLCNLPPQQWDRYFERMAAKYAEVVCDP